MDGDSIVNEHLLRTEINILAESVFDVFHQFDPHSYWNGENEKTKIRKQLASGKAKDILGALTVIKEETKEKMPQLSAEADLTAKRIEYFEIRRRNHASERSKERFLDGR